jgi:phosphate-selective porin OprO/OprP
MLLIGGACILLAATPLHARTQVPAALTATDERDELRAQVARLQAAVAMLEARLDKVEGTGAVSTAAGAQSQLALTTSPITSTPSAAASAPDTPGTEISWKGSPQLAQGDARFKIKGRLQYDAGYLAAPPLRDSTGPDRARGFSSEARRVRLGAEGALGSGFGYKLEVELSDNVVDLVDAYITYRKGKWLVTLGNHNSFQSLDELISDTAGSVMERAAFTDAFNFERRLGLSAQYQTGAILVQGGVFTDSADSLANGVDGVKGGDENNSIALDGRLVFAPRIAGGQLHFGGSYHWRHFGRLSDDSQSYRQRPYLHTVNSRFLSASVRADTESHYGVEAAGVFGRFHYAAEAHWLTAVRRGQPDPTFFGAYGEVGYFLTKGDTRPYVNGILGTAKPARAIGKGGPGAIQINLRYDYLTLNDHKARVMGGKQNGIIAGVIWTPVQYLRLNINYAYLSYLDAAILANAQRDYSVNVLGARAELDF